jgi:hypothetical protein
MLSNKVDKCRQTKPRENLLAATDALVYFEGVQKNFDLFGRMML